jgi:hypothetical protein
MFAHNPMMTMVSTAGQPSNRAPSPKLWNGLRGQFFSPDGTTRLKMLGNDFIDFGGTVASNVGSYSSSGGRFYSYEDNSCTIAQIATNRDGAVALTTPATDNVEAWLQPGGTASVSSVISTTAGDDKVLAFEARVKFSSIANSTNFFVGLSEEGTAIENTIGDDAVLVATKDFIGFRVNEADGDSLIFMYQKGSQTAQTVLTYGTALVADTYYKLGFLFNPDEQDSKKIKIFIDGTEQTTYVTATNLAAATFPNGEELQPLFGLKNGSAGAKVLTMDWYALGAGG